MNRKRTLGRKLLASAGAGALGLLGVVGLASTAMAADPGNIDPDETGSLTIHKHLGLPTDLANNGTQLADDALDPDDNPPAEKVEFKLQQVGVINSGGTCVALNPAVAGDWDAIQAATSPLVTGTTEGDYCVAADKGTQETNASGVVTFTPLDLGFYYVTEGADNGGNNIVKKTAPFFVTVPFPSYAGTSPTAERVWTYDVHVYPKNQAAEVPTKTISDTPSMYAVGATVVWTIDAVVPTLADDDSFTQGSVYDQLDSRLTFKSSKVYVDGTEVTDASVVTKPAENATGTLTWSFVDPAGLALLKANQGKTITVELTTEVNATIGDGQIENAPGTPGNGYGSSFNDVPTPGDETPVTLWGQLVVNKQDNSTPAKPLKDAEFKVFEKSAATCPTEAPATGAVATGTSNADGVVQWDASDPASSPLGLWIGNWDKKTDVPVSPSKDYCVYETKVPAGYTGSTGAQVATITPGSTTPVAITVTNAQKDVPDLPETGANGTRLMIIGGSALVLIAGGLFLARRRQEQQ